MRETKRARGDRRGGGGGGERERRGEREREREREKLTKSMTWSLREAWTPAMKGVGVLSTSNSDTGSMGMYT